MIRNEEFPLGLRFGCKAQAMLGMLSKDISGSQTVV